MLKLTIADGLLCATLLLFGPFVLSGQVTTHDDGARPPAGTKLLNDTLLANLTVVAINVNVDGEKEIDNDTYRAWLAAPLERVGIKIIAATENPFTYPRVALSINVLGISDANACAYTVDATVKHLVSASGSWMVLGSTSSSRYGFSPNISLYGVLRDAVTKVGEALADDIREAKSQQ